MKLPIPGKSTWISVGIVVVTLLVVLNFGRRYASVAGVVNTARGYLGLA
jgi:hypothetical protein